MNQTETTKETRPEIDTLLRDYSYEFSRAILRMNTSGKASFAKAERLAAKIFKHIHGRTPRPDELTYITGS